jgi:hypothetical protein
MLPFLEDYGPDLGGHALHLYRWLQLLSSVVGLLVVIWAIWRWSRAEIPADMAGARVGAGSRGAELGAVERQVWLAAYVLILLLALLTLLAVVTLAPRGAHLAAAPGIFLTRLAFAGLAGSGVSLLLVSTLIRVRVAWRGRPLDA